MADVIKGERLNERRFTTLKINLQGDDEEGTDFISQTWLNPKLDGNQFNFQHTHPIHWMKPGMIDEKDRFRDSIPGDGFSSDEDDRDSSSDRSSRLRSPPVLMGYPQKRPRSVTALAGVVKAVGRFKNSVKSKSSPTPTSAREDRLIFPGEQTKRKSQAAILAELRMPSRRRTKTKVTFENEEELKLEEVRRPTKKVSADELDTIVSRLIRPTNASRARTATVRPKFFFEEKRRPEPKRVDWLVFAPTRFRGLRKVGHEEIEEITNRLHSFDIERWPPNSARGLRRHTSMREELIPINSPRLKGIKGIKDW
ncbi:hypothetical protein FSP39_006753 [Pinctada imbricata]|uniref:Uncharacterized protein n=1 Tax=Pinctada imbricata TaxID=66713 RepID=A0AA89BVU9_PINIB|nr:hypothetical protein FSP39_006753 [Pinctada imbricata]